MQTLATADNELLSRMLSAESFHVLVDDTGMVCGRGTTLVALHAGEEGISSAAELLECLAPAGGLLSFERLQALAGELLLLEYRPLGLRLKGQFFVAPTGRYGVFLGAPCGVGEFPGTAAAEAAGRQRGGRPGPAPTPGPAASRYPARTPAAAGRSGRKIPRPRHREP